MESCSVVLALSVGLGDVYKGQILNIVQNMIGQKGNHLMLIDKVGTTNKDRLARVSGPYTHLKLPTNA